MGRGPLERQLRWSAVARRRLVDRQLFRSRLARRLLARLPESHYRFILWLVPTVERFPRRQKFLLGDRIQATALDVLERLIEATYTRRRSGRVASANLGLEKLRLLIRLARYRRLLDPRRYEHAARHIDDTGHRVGAWTKAHRASESARPV